MKRKSTASLNDETKLSKLLFNKSRNLVEKLKTDVRADDFEANQKPAWEDEDDAGMIVPNITKHLYSDKLKQKFETLVGTPNWAKLKTKDDADNESALRTVGHLKKEKCKGLPKTLLQMKRMPKINAETGNEGPIISCIEFHPKISVALVAGSGGVVSLFSINGDTNNKLHNFKLRTWKLTSAHFVPDGSEAYLASKFHHSYCVYDLVKAKPQIVQLPRECKKPIIFKMSPNGTLLATSDCFDEVFIICVKSKELLRCLKLNTNVVSLAFSHDSTKLYCYGAQGEISLWDLSTYRALLRFYDEGCVTASTMTVSSCGKLVATGTGEGIVNVYETENVNSNAVPLKTITNLTTKITNLNFNKSSEILAISSAYYPNAIKLVHLPSYNVFCNYPNTSSNLNQIDSVSFSPNSGYMGVGNNKGCAYLYRLKHYKNY